MNSISPICFGCEPLGGTDWGDVDIGDITNAIHLALELGVNFFDTAGVYGLGLSECRLSEILGNRRHDLVIATKGGFSWRESGSGRNVVFKDSSPLAIRMDVENSLKRLRLETLPIFFVHWPDINTRIEDTFIELLKLKNDGKIQSIGCSNFSAHQLERACRVSKIDYIQMPLNIIDGTLDKNILDICNDNNIKIIAYNVLLNGLLTGKFNKETKFKENDRRSRLPLFKGLDFISALDSVEKLKIKAAKKNTSLVHYSINWALMQENIFSVIIGIKDSKQMSDNWLAIKT